MENKFSITVTHNLIVKDYFSNHNNIAVASKHLEINHKTRATHTLKKAKYDLESHATTESLTALRKNQHCYPLILDF